MTHQDKIAEQYAHLRPNWPALLMVARRDYKKAIKNGASPEQVNRLKRRVDAILSAMGKIRKSYLTP
jgi:hypothetical protein